MCRPWISTGRSPGARGFRLQLRSPRPAQQRPHARHQLANAKRFDQIVVGAALEAQHLVAFLAARGEHQDRHILVGTFAADGAGHGDAVDARQHQVEDDQIEGTGVRADQRVLAVGHRLGLEALEAEVEHDQVANVRVVFDDEDAGHD